MITWLLASFVLAVRLVQPASETSSVDPGHGSCIRSDRSSEGNDPGPQFRRGEVADEETEEEGLDEHEPADIAVGERVGSSLLSSLPSTDSALHPCTTNDQCRSLRGPPGDPPVLGHDR
jgi:hypothetical protein